MSDTAQKRAIRNYRSRLTEQGISRFEVLALNTDRDLIRSLAQCLVEGGPEARDIRASVSRTVAGGASNRGGILKALRRSPLVGAGLDLKRSKGTGRKVDL